MNANINKATNDKINVPHAFITMSLNLPARHERYKLNASDKYKKANKTISNIEK